MTMDLHHGKLSARIETNVPEAFSDLLGAHAHALGIAKADFVRELLFLAITGETYSFHEAKDKESRTKEVVGKIRESSGANKGRL